MANEIKPSRDIDEMLRAAVEKSWKDPDARQGFERIGIKSEHELEDKLSRAIKDPAARSFDRDPDPKQGQTDRSTVVEAKVLDQQKKEHTITVVMNPERDEQGKVQGGDARVDDRAKQSGLSQELAKEYDKGKDPLVLMRGPDLNRSEEQSLKSPISRMDRGGLGGFDKPTYERNKQVTPVQQQKADLQQQNQEAKVTTRPTLLERLQQEKPKIVQELGDRHQQHTRNRDHEMGR